MILAKNTDYIREGILILAFFLRFMNQFILCISISFLFCDNQLFL
jgi:hypothetical protein